jgi:hypothetical protein
MPQSWFFDWVSFWILLGLTLWEGVRRVPAGAVLLRNAAGYPWQVAAGPYAAQGWRLASWLSPLVCHLVLVPGPGEGRTAPRHLRRWAAALRVPSLLALLALVVGVPLLTASAGVVGLIQAVVLAFGASLLAALASVLALWRMGVPVKAALGDALPLISPFAAPRAPEIVLARALDGVGFADALRCLLPADAFAEWMRPVAYDLSRGLAEDGVSALLPAGEAAAILRARPAESGAGDVYCARCGRVYLPTATACRACEGAEMVRIAD